MRYMVILPFKMFNTKTIPVMFLYYIDFTKEGGFYNVKILS